MLSWSLKWKDDGVFCCGGKQCKFSVAEILHSYLESRRAVNYVRNMEVVDLRSLIQSCCPVPSCGRPSTSGGAGGVSSRFLHSTSGGRVVADTGVHLSANPGNVSGEELLASSSHRASTQVADLSASRVLNESGVNATSSPVADLTSQRRDRSGEYKVSARKLVLFFVVFLLLSTVHFWFCFFLLPSFKS